MAQLFWSFSAFDQSFGQIFVNFAVFVQYLLKAKHSIAPNSKNYGEHKLQDGKLNHPVLVALEEDINL